MNTSFLLRRILPVLILVALVVGLFFWTTRAKPISVVLKTVDRGTVESTVVNTRAGTVEACQRTKLSTILGGRIEILNVKEGDRVKRGQLLLKLWNDDQKAQQNLATTQLELSRRRVVEACTVAASARRESPSPSAPISSATRSGGAAANSSSETASSESASAAMWNPAA